MATRPVTLNQVFFVSILGAMTLYSAYELFFAEKSLIFTQAPRGIASTEGDREPAAVTPAFLPLVLECGNNPATRTKAAKVKLTLPLCRQEKEGSDRLIPNKDGKAPKEINVVNKMTLTPATVFIDQGSVSTALINLNSGDNVISIEYTYTDGQTVRQDVSIVREP